MKKYLYSFYVSRLIIVCISVIWGMCFFTSCSDMTIPEFIERNIPKKNPPSDEIIPPADPNPSAPPVPNIIAIVPKGPNDFLLYWTIESLGNDNDAVEMIVSESDSSQATQPAYKEAQFGGTGDGNNALPYRTPIHFDNPVAADVPLTLTVKNKNNLSASALDSADEMLIYANNDGEGDGVFLLEPKNFSRLMTQLSLFTRYTNVTVMITEDITEDEDLLTTHTIPQGKNVIIEPMGDDFTVKKVKQGFFQVSGTLTIRENSGNILSFEGLSINQNGDSADNNVSLFSVSHGGNLKLIDGVIGKNTSSVSNGGGVRVEIGGSFVMGDPSKPNASPRVEYNEISSVSSGKLGGGVYVASGAQFTMYSKSSVNNNTAADNGGGVYITDGLPPSTADFTMYNEAIISNNTAVNGGGGVYLGQNSVFTMNNSATISSNTANDGGGVYVDKTTFTINTGSIDGNKANNNGGGIYVFNNTESKLFIYGAAIKNNNANEDGFGGGDGGGVYMDIVASGNHNMSAALASYFDNNSVSGDKTHIFANTYPNFGL